MNILIVITCNTMVALFCLYYSYKIASTLVERIRLVEKAIMTLSNVTTLEKNRLEVQITCLRDDIGGMSVHQQFKDEQLTNLESLYCNLKDEIHRVKTSLDNLNVEVGALDCDVQELQNR